MPLQYIKTQNESLNGTKKDPFFCSICTETKSRYKDRIKCAKCARFVCKDCFENLGFVGLHKCPYCSSPLSLNGVTSEKEHVVKFIKAGEEKRTSGDFITAEFNFRIAISLDSGSALAWKNLGLLYFQQKIWEQARHCFSNVLKINPKDHEAKEKFIQADYLIRSYYF